MNANDMFNITLRFDIKEANRITLYFAYSGIKNVFAGGI